MGSKSLPPGVELRPGGLRIYFQYQGRKFREPLGLEPTPANIKHAGRLVAQIKAEIRAGVFDYPAKFPDSKALPKSSAASNPSTVGDLIATWLRLQGHLADSTLSSYRSALRVLDRFVQLAPSVVTASRLGIAFDEHGFRTAKGRNNAITPIRSLFELAVKDGLIRSNPADELKFAKVQEPEPDPLQPDEIDLVLSWLREHRDPQAVNYFEFAFWSGMRTSELLGLEWSDIDWRAKTARVRRAVVNGKAKSSTKTARVRDVELADPAVAALKRQRAASQLFGGRIFLDPLTNRPFIDDKPPRLIWIAALRGVGLRHRAAYQTRHTYATLCLMRGANPMWVSRQLGHASLQMTLRVYARWLPDADKGRELAKINAPLVSEKSQTRPQEE